MFRKGDEPIAGYRLEQFLGKGQFGEVWRTTAPGGTSAALKFIDLGGKQGVKEFRGVQRVKEIRHANLMPITALWMLDGEGNILSNKAMESYDPEIPAARATLMVSQTTNEVRPEWLVVAMLLGKKNLMDRLSECAAAGQPGIPPEELLRYMEEAAKGIDYLNSAQHDLGEGVVAVQHCDIKPANIMLIGDAAVVCDFGLARVLTDAAGVTATGMVGSPAYMAPECIRRKPGLGSDQYSLAVSYVELRSGHLPFKELTYVEVLEANRQAKLDLSRLPPAEQQVIRKASSLKPDDRYPSAVAMVHALRRAIEGVPEPQTTLSRPLLAVIAIVATVIALGVGIALRGGGTPKAKAYSLTFVPPNATVRMNNIDQSLTDGVLSAELPSDEPVSIEVTPPAEATGPAKYLPLKKQYSLDELKRAEYRIQLSDNGEYYSQLADRLIAEGKDAEALAAFQTAVRADPKFERPEPILLNKHTMEVGLLAFSPNNNWLVSAGDGGQVYRWDLSKAREQPPIPVVMSGHDTQTIESIAISNDGHWLVTGSRDQTAIVWDLTAADPSKSAVKLEGHQGAVVATAITREWIITAGNTTVRRWRLVDGKPTADAQVLEGHEPNLMKDIRVSADGRWLVSIDLEGNVIRWDLSQANPQSSKLQLEKISHRQHCLLLTPDNNWLVFAADDNDGEIQLCALDKKQTPTKIKCATDVIESLAINRSGTQLLVGDTKGSILPVELNSGGQAKPGPELGQQAGACLPLAIAPHEKYFVSGNYDARLWQFPASGKQSAGSLSLFSKMKSAGGSKKVTAVAISADSNWFATATDDGTVELWDAARCQLLFRVTGGDRPQTKAPVQTTQRPDRGLILH